MPKNIPQNVLKVEKGNTSDQELLQDAHRDMPATFLASCFELPAVKEQQQRQGKEVLRFSEQKQLG